MFKKIWSTKNPTQIVTKHKNLICDNSKTQFVTNQKLKLWQIKNSNCDKTQTENVTTQKLKFWQNSKTQIVSNSTTQIVA